MVSTQKAEKITANEAIELIDFDPNLTTVVDAKWVDLQEFESFLVGFMRTIGTSAFTLIIRASEVVAGTNPETIIAHAVGSEPNAVEDQIFLECSAEMVREVGAALATVKNLRFVSAAASFATGTDEGVFVYVRSRAKFPTKALTLDVVA